MGSLIDARRARHEAQRLERASSPSPGRHASRTPGETAALFVLVLVALQVALYGLVVILFIAAIAGVIWLAL